MSLETMTKISTVTVGAGGSASISFSNIPQHYTDLVLKLSTRTTASGWTTTSLALTFNGSSASVYSRKTQYNTSAGGSGSDGTSLTTSFTGAISSCGASSTSNTFGFTNVYISNYSGNAFKNILVESLSENDGTDTTVNHSAGLFSSSSPITSLTLVDVNSGSFVQNSTVTLYGVKNVVKTASNSIKATGGNIVFDGTYVYHVFSASGAFVPTQSLTADIVSVGGGGGGGWNNAGGGGGGEVDISKNLSIAAGSSNTVTIGGGGATATSTAGAGANGGTSGFSTSVVSLGGGGGGTGDATTVAYRSGQTGGSGGGGSLDNGGGSASGSNTNAGSAGFAVGSGPERYAGGGGGGATSAAVNADGSSRVSGAGGQGYALASIFSGLTLGNITHFGSGGSGGIYVNGNSGLAAAAGTNAGRGGQQSTTGNVNPTEATPNAGGGGGGGSYTGVNSRQGSNGGSGIVIVRYKG